MRDIILANLSACSCEELQEGNGAQNTPPKKSILQDNQPMTLM
jgi:hypothetical protein